MALFKTFKRQRITFLTKEEACSRLAQKRKYNNGPKCRAKRLADREMRNAASRAQYAAQKLAGTLKPCHKVRKARGRHPEGFETRIFIPRQ